MKMIIIIQGAFAVIKLKKNVVDPFKAVDVEDKLYRAVVVPFVFSWLWNLVFHFVKKHVCKQCSRKRVNVGDMKLLVNFGY